MINQDLFNLALAGAEVESSDFVKLHDELSAEFVPNIDFSDPTTFVHFGRAAQYYEDTFNVIKNTHPYDGSFAEKLLWYKNLPWVDRYFFDKIYPRRTGYAIFSANGWGSSVGTIDNVGLSNNVEYIKFYGGPHAYNEGEYKFDKSNILDLVENRGNNLAFGLGNTVEFALKKETQELLTEEEVILDIWNGKTGGEYSRVLVAIVTTPGSYVFRTEYYVNNQGYSTVSSVPIDYSPIPNMWALSFDTLGSVNIYLNGTFLETTTGFIMGLMITLCDRDLKGVIGCYQGATKVHALTFGYGKLSASIDEFRFWKTIRTEKQIWRYYNQTVGGGTNTDVANTDLGVYFKFNEGIVGSSIFDRNVIDYSGRISNGAWVGYTSNSRSEDSLLEEAGFTAAEYAEPVLYEAYPEFISLQAEYIKKGQSFDLNNKNSVFFMVPAYIIDDDNTLGEGQWALLAQIMGAMFDQISLQIQFMVDFKHPEYQDVLKGNNPFGSRLLADVGLPSEQLLALTTMIEEYFKRSEDLQFEIDIYKIRNLMYMHLYKNMVHILKAKGTLNSIRNMVRCFGIDDEVLRLHAYVDGDKKYLNQLKTRLVERKKRFLSFAAVDNHEGTVYGNSDPLILTDSSYTPLPLAPLTFAQPITVECDVIFPTIDHELSFIKSSIFGVYEDDGAGQWAATPAMFQVYSERHPTLEGYVRFILESTGMVIAPLETDYFEDVYSHSYWNFAVRLVPKGESAHNLAVNDFSLEFVGFNVISGYTKESFSLSATVLTADAMAFIEGRKRFYVGALYQDWNNGVLCESDVMIGNLRVYLDYVTDEVLLNHANDPVSVGVEYATRPGFLGQFWDGTYQPLLQMNSLVFDWGFSVLNTEALTFTVEDEFHGAVPNNYYEPWIYDVIHYRYPATADFFVNLTSPGLVLHDEYFSVWLKDLPYDDVAAGGIELKEDYELEYFTKNAVPSRVVYTLEKSAAGVVSQAMLKFIGCLENFGDMFGQGVDRYRTTYKRLDAARRLFFDRVENQIDFERFLSYYRWINYAIGSMVSSLIPASDNFIGMYDVIESHALERNKYQSKFNIIKQQEHPDIEARVFGMGSLRYSAQTGAFVDWTDPDRTRKHCVWWKRRADRSLPDITSGDAVIDAARNAIRDVIELHNKPTTETQYDPVTLLTYSGRAFALRSLGEITSFRGDIMNSFHAGTNFPHDKKLAFGASGIGGDGIQTLFTSELPVNKHCLDYEGLSSSTIVDVRKSDNSNNQNRDTSAVTTFPGTFYRDQDGDIQVTNCQNDSYLPGSDQCIENVVLNYGGKRSKWANEPFSAPAIQDYEITFDIPSGNWTCDKELTPIKKPFLSNIIQDVARPCVIANVKR